MKAYFEAVLDCLGFVVLFLIAGMLFCVTKLLIAAALGVDPTVVTVALVIFGLVAGAIKTALDRRRARDRDAALDKVIAMWKESMEVIKRDPDLKNADAMLAAYAITIKALENEQVRKRGHRGG